MGFSGNGTACFLDGGFSEWQSWGACSEECGPGVRSRNRTCDDPAPETGGLGCSSLGPYMESESCNEGNCTLGCEADPCHMNATCDDDGVLGGYNCTCNMGFAGNGMLCFLDGDCPSPLYPGDDECDDATNIAECDWDGGDCCGDNITTAWCETCACLDPEYAVACEADPCHMNATCSDDGVPGGYSYNCTCNMGFSGNGTACFLDGGFSEWQSWGACSEECGPGVRSRNRTCDDPAPETGGLDCSTLGPDMESESCNEGNCTLACDADPCHEDATCIDDGVPVLDINHVIGYNFNCTCISGFSGNGTTCISDG